ncbi:MAG: formate dehydrogenase accessory sulfurtransferase FdhD [Lachnospiraceae bacterium]|nr:formate dehydrogenase accessory sulfurtransferase FdhD [Lachnospiraceae bacterium]
MNISDNFREYDTTAEQAFLLFSRDGKRREVRESLIHEHFTEISVNCTPVLKLACTGDHLKELVIGRLYTEGMIDGTGEVERLFICGQGLNAEVSLKKKVEFGAVTEREPSCCTGNKMLASVVGGRKMKPLPETEPDEKAVFALADRFKEDSALHRATFGTHSCYIYLPDGSIECFEDISRHNAMDKAVGYALLNDIKLSECMLYTTGRVPEDMVRKAVMAGVPVLISKAVPTDASVRLAAEYGLTLICSAWPDSFKLCLCTESGEES